MKMDKEKELPKRKPTRLQAFDYNTTGAYFITICTDKRRQILSRIVGVDVLGDPQNVEFLSHGMVADKYIKQMNEFYENLTVDTESFSYHRSFFRLNTKFTISLSSLLRIR